jgi:hypothetical protein
MSLTEGIERKGKAMFREPTGLGRDRVEAAQLAVSEYTDPLLG